MKLKTARRTTVATLACLLFPLAVSAQEADLTKLDLADLLQVEVTSVSRKAQTLARTAAAVHVITQEDIRRSGAQTVPDLLRMVPGFNVAQIDANSWAVSARGFSALYSNKLLVLVDGRSVYTPLFGGVHWDMQNLPLGDIDRIEVIRGPGGTLWGANAMNGVINIITKPAQATQGTSLIAETGGQQRGDVQARFGARLGDAGHYRIYGRRLRRGSNEALEGFADPDLGETTIGGARFDWTRGPEHSFSLHGSVQDGSVDKIRTQTVVLPYSRREVRERSMLNEANVVFSWTHAPSRRSEYGLQTYYNYYERTGTALVDTWHTFDVDARHRRMLGDRHELVAGGNVRYWANSINDGVTFQVHPSDEHQFLLGGFAQDEIELVRDRVRAAAGVKLEKSAYAGRSSLELQPSARVTWTPAVEHAFWGAASRATRTPARVDRGMEVPVAVSTGPRGLPLVIALQGSEDYKPESLQAFEAGYRMQRRAFSVDVTAFTNRYDDLESVEPQPMTTGFRELTAVWRVPLVFGNLMNASASGAEVSGTWRVANWWKVSGAYSRLNLVLTPDATSRDTGTKADEEGSAPRYQAHLRTYIDLPFNLEASVLGYHVAALPALSVPAYTRVDVRLGWSWRHLDVAVGAQNLGHSGQREFVEESNVKAIDIAPRAFAQLGIRF